MSLTRKMLRDMRNNKTQFIAIFMMALIGIFAYCGVCSEYYGLEQTSSDFYSETNLADGWIYNTTITDDAVDEIDNFSTGSERQLVIQSVGEFENDPDITLHFLENNTISKFYLVEGEELNLSDDSGVWLDKRFANAQNLTVGDNITFKLNGLEIEKEIKGIGYSPEYVYEASPTTIIPDFKDMGFAYLSHEAFPMDIQYNALLVKFNQSPEDFKDSLDDSVDYLSFTKQADHVSVSQFNEEMAQHKMIGDVFPLLFIAVTFLTLLTTMTRIVSHQRTQIGVLKAVGYKNRTIILHFMSYGFWLVLAGAILGLVTGPMVIPNLFYPTMSSRYSLPEWHPGFDNTFIIVAAAMVISSLLVSYWAARNISKENPANTMRPKAPNVSSSGVLEKSGFWKKLGFNLRWNYRDAKRNRFRALMAIIGVMGCVGLLICAFGMDDSMDNLASWEYDDISHFESKLFINSNATFSDIDEVADEVNGSTIMEQAIEIKAHGNEKTAMILSLNETDLISQTDKYQNPINLTSTDISLSAKVAETLGVDVGDSIKWHIVGSDDWVECKITNIHGEPMSQGIILSADKLEDLDLNFTPTSILSDEKVDDDYDSIKSVSTIGEMMENWDEMSGSIMMLVSIIIIFAVLLAIVVLYNLGILSFTEIEREIATLKVLGFKTRDLRKLLLTQNLFFTGIGFLLGIPLGFYLMTLIMNAAGETIYYIPSLTWGNIALSAVITFTISIAVNLLFSGKIKNLNMVEALKDVE
ncbi:ABC transporter permease [Methanobrevibacter millerae]|uniref:Putative ABC transport system permease protein n=1 Tax=Methanobrevibacter millerae TaxID=230361 RepID=A0A1G5UUG9_9EURY|nr:ABC transporter permease [Methanobrevibacter millerae]SDA37263.1 putative ABC transport system permease protein [Methanobrevibacter millerae]